jgi:hypothetical protein
MCAFVWADDDMFAYLLVVVRYIAYIYHVVCTTIVVVHVCAKFSIISFMHLCLCCML